MVRRAVPPDIAAIRDEIRRFLNTIGEDGAVVGNSKYGVYAFYDYDGEPIYVGQTKERLRSRISRHLTNQRTDAVAMNVLDPFEVAEIEVWPIREQLSENQMQKLLNSVEFTVFQKVLSQSKLGAVLNEKDVPRARRVKLPPSYRGKIIPGALYEIRKHPDTRIARRASTIASLARVISERDVSKGLRRTLLIQAKRLERLADQRLNEVSGQIPIEGEAEETGEEAAE
jgi:GIY-YIG catalytic domain